MVSDKVALTAVCVQYVVRGDQRAGPTAAILNEHEVILRLPPGGVQVNSHKFLLMSVTCLWSASTDRHKRWWTDSLCPFYHRAERSFANV